MISKEIEQSWKKLAADIHANPTNYCKEIHHIWGRIGILRCCVLLVAVLSHKEHNDWQVLKQLREETLAIKLLVLANYLKGLGCYMPEELREPISNKCYQCPMYKGKR